MGNPNIYSTYTQIQTPVSNALPNYPICVSQNSTTGESKPVSQTGLGHKRVRRVYLFNHSPMLNISLSLSRMPPRNSPLLVLSVESFRSRIQSTCFGVLAVETTLVPLSLLHMTLWLLAMCGKGDIPLFLIGSLFGPLFPRQAV